MPLKIADIDIGTFRHRVDIQVPQQTTTAHGAAVLTAWRTIGAIWCEITPTGGVEMFFAQQAKAIVSHMVLMRFWPNLNAAMRLSYTDPGQGERFLNIISVENVEERKVFLNVYCKEGAP